MKKESVIELQKSLDKLISAHSKLISEGRINEAFNVMKNVESITRQLREFGVPITIEEESNNQFLDWYSVLKFFIETKQSQLIELDYSNRKNEMKHRATGKTTTLLKLSNNYGIPILVKNYQSDGHNLEEYAKTMGLHVRIVDLRMLDMLQFQNIDILLVDEATTFYILSDDFKINHRGTNLHNKILIGFKRKSNVDFI